MGKDFFSFFQSSPDLLMCVMVPATEKKKTQKENMLHIYIRNETNK